VKGSIKRKVMRGGTIMMVSRVEWSKAEAKVFLSGTESEPDAEAGFIEVMSAGGDRLDGKWGKQKVPRGEWWAEFEVVSADALDALYEVARGNWTFKVLSRR